MFTVMKKLTKYIVWFSAAALSLAACQKVEEFKPGEADPEGCYGVYFKETAFDEVFAPEDTPKTIEITLVRTLKDGEISVPVVVDTEAGDTLVFSEVKFDDGAPEATLAVTLDGDKARIGVTYTASVTIDDPQYASRYSTHPTSADLSIIIDKWNDLGKAKFSDNFFFENSYEVTLEQNDLDKNKFRLVSPYAGALKAEEAALNQNGLSVTGSGPEYLNFTLLQKGDEVNEVKITKADFVNFETYFTGISYTKGSHKIYAYTPADALGNYFTEDALSCNKVLAYQTSGLPGAVELAPYYYMPTYPYGWDYTVYDGVILIQFPGYTYADYSIALTAYESEDGETPVYVEAGADVASVKYAVYDGELSAKDCAAKAKEIEGGTAADVKTVTAEEIEKAKGYISLTCATSGPYTVVAVSFDADGTAQEYDYTSFGYIAKDDDTSYPIVFNASVLPATSSSLRYVLMGSGLTVVKVQAFTKAFYDSYAKYAYNLTYSDTDTEALDEKTLASVNDAGYAGTVKSYLSYDAKAKKYVDTPLSADTEYVVIVYVENGYRSDAKVFTATTPAE